MAASCQKESKPSETIPPALFRIKVANNKVKVQGNDISVSWSNYIHHEAYELTISDSTETTTPQTYFATVRTAEKSYTFKNLKPNTRYRVGIKALNLTWGICSEFSYWSPISTNPGEEQEEE